MPRFECTLNVGAKIKQVEKIVRTNYADFEPDISKATDGTIRFPGVHPEMVAELKSILVALGLHPASLDETTTNWFGIETKPFFTDTELREARYVNLDARGEYIDIDRELRNLNRFGKIICKKCGLVAELPLPKPYVVSDQNALSPQDLYRGLDGILFASEKAKKIVLEVCGESVLVCDVEVRHTKKVKVLRGQDYGVRPKHHIGKDVSFIPAKKVCSSCGQPPRWQFRPNRKDEFERELCIFDSFGPVSWDIALSAQWNGTRIKSPKQPASFTYWMYMSGKLYAALRDDKIKGLSGPMYVVYTRETAKAMLEGLAKHHKPA